MTPTVGESQVRDDIDLASFARRRELPPRPQRWKRFVLPIALVLGFTGILSGTLRDMLAGEIPVTVLRPLPAAATAEGQVSTSFQAAGWVEPDPFLLHVTPLTSGVIADVLVQESDVIKSGQVVARLVADDAELELAAAEAAVRLANADIARTKVELQYAREDFEAAIALNEQVSVAEAEAQQTEAEAAHRTSAVAGGQARVTAAEHEVEVQKYLAAQGASGPRQVELAEAARDESRADLGILRATAAAARSAAEKAKARRVRAHQDQELRIADRRRVAVAEADLAVAEAKAREALAARDVASLRRQRVDVVSPVDGVVLERLAYPGIPIGTGPGMQTSICSLYDPSSLRIRVDVPQEEIAKTFLGQRTRITSRARASEAYGGVVVRRVEQSDIQKVTLQVHVKVEDPDELLRPEMLCQVRFLARARDEASPNEVATPVLRIPQKLIVDGKAVWVAGPDLRSALLRPVRLGTRIDDLVEVLGGLNLSDKLIDRGRQRLDEGSRILIVEED